MNRIGASDLDADGIVAELARRASPIGRPVSIVPVTTSTNDDAKRAAQDGAPSGSAFLAEMQTNGRGRLGRTWHSPARENLYASFLVRPSFDPKRLPLVTLAAGLAVAEAIDGVVTAARVALKWPNDVLVDDRKVAGILAEAHLASPGDETDRAARSPWIVIGIGINVHTTSLPPEIAQRATSLALAGATTLDRSSLFVEVATRLAVRLDDLGNGDPAAIVAAVSARDALAGRAVTVDGVAVTATGIAENGALRIRRADGTESTCIAGDVQLRTERPPHPR